MYIYLRTPKTYRCARAYISAWASVLLVQMKGHTRASVAEQQQCSPAFLYICLAFVWKRSTISQVTAFCVLLLSMSNFSLDVQGILRTSRYEEKLLVDLVSDSKRTNKNQSVFCKKSVIVVPLQAKV